MSLNYPLTVNTISFQGFFCFCFLSRATKERQRYFGKSAWMSYPGILLYFTILFQINRSWPRATRSKCSAWPFHYTVYSLWLFPRRPFQLNFTIACDFIHSFDPSQVVKSSTLGRMLEARLWSRPSVDLACWPKTFNVHCQSPLALACSNPFAVILPFQFEAESGFLWLHSCMRWRPSSSQLNPVSFDHIPAFAVDKPTRR